jgi:hypothetical protein
MNKAILLALLTLSVLPARADDGQARREKRREAVKDVMDDCAADAEKFCKDVPKGKGRVVRCLKEHEGQLSPACKETLAAHTAEWGKMKMKKPGFSGMK